MDIDLAIYILCIEYAACLHIFIWPSMRCAALMSKINKNNINAGNFYLCNNQI